LVDDSTMMVSVRCTPSAGFTTSSQEAFELARVGQPHFEQVVPGAGHVMAFEHGR